MKVNSYLLFDFILQEMLLGKMELKKLRAGLSQMVVLMLLVRLVMTRERLTMMRVKKEMKNWVAATAMMEKRVINWILAWQVSALNQSHRCLVLMKK